MVRRDFRSQEVTHAAAQFANDEGRQRGRGLPHVHRAALRRRQRQHCHERSGFDLGRMRARDGFGVSPAIQRGGKLGIVGVDAHEAAGCGNGAKQRTLHARSRVISAGGPPPRNSSKETAPRSASAPIFSRLDAWASASMAKSTMLFCPASAAASKPLTLSTRGAVFGIAMMVVTPPRAAAHEVERKSSL